MQTKKIVEIIEVEEIYTIIEQGFTMPVKCRLKNGMNVIVKYMRNPAGSQVLINEWIGSNIADIIGLTYAKEIKGLLTVEEIDKSRYSIPFSWQESVGKEKINQLFEVLKKEYRLLMIL